MPTVSDFANLGVFKVHNGGDTSGANDGLPATTFAGGIAQPNGNITANNFPYVYFDGTNEMGGTAVRLRFYAAGRYFGNFTTAQAAAGIKMVTMPYGQLIMHNIWLAMLCLTLQEQMLT